MLKRTVPTFNLNPKRYFPNEDSRHKLAYRLIKEEDAKLLVDFFYKLSPQTMKMRFNGITGEIPSLKQVWKLSKLMAKVDNEKHLALLATVQKSIGERIVGVARYVEISDNPDAVDLSIVIRDDFQHQGVGSSLFRSILEIATEKGYKKVYCDTMAENIGFINFINSQGFNLYRQVNQDNYRFEINLVGV